MRVMFVINDLGVNEPFGPMILSAILKEKGHQTILGVLQKEDVEKKINFWKPDVLAYSMMSVDMKNMRNFNLNLRKKRKIFTILGGAHATLDPGCVNDSGVDAVCIGEGEDVILEVLNGINTGKSLEAIQNIMVPGGQFPKLRKLIDNFEAYPFMDRELVYSYPEARRFGIKGIWATRGCFYPCPYCFNNRINETFKKCGKVVRKRSVDSIIREMHELIKHYRVSFIRIQDDVFVHQADEWLKEFSRCWPKEIGLPFYCLLRAELVTEEMAYYLKKAGCFSMCMSIESGNDDIRMRMMRRKVTKGQLETTFKIFKKYKINVYANTMFALPFTTLEQDIESLDFSIRVKPELPDFSIFMPYPGTDLGDFCRKAGIYNQKNENISYGMCNMSPLSCFTEEEKNAQYNLCQLGIVAVKFPRLRNLIVKRLIYLKPNFLFFLVHYVFSMYAYGKKIFYFSHTFFEYIELIFRTVRHKLYDFTKKTDKRVKIIEGLKEELMLSEDERRKEFLECINALSLIKNENNC